MDVVSEKVLDKAKLLWKLGDDISFVRKMANFIYYCPKKKVYLRLTEESHRCKHQVESELHWMDYLKNEGLNFAHPVRSNNEKLVESISLDDEIFFVTCFKEAPGKRVQGEDNFTPQILNNWGRLTANLHKATQGYLPPQSIAKRASWKEEEYHLNIINTRNKSDGLIYDESIRIEELFENLEQTPENFGLIHADLHTGNFNVDTNGKITVFDFDDCVYHWFLYDIATIFWCFDRLSLDKKVCSYHFLEGYAEINKIPNFSESLIEEFYRYREILIYYYTVWKVESSNFDETVIKRFQDHIVGTYKFFNIKENQWRIKPI